MLLPNNGWWGQRDNSLSLSHIQFNLATVLSWWFQYYGKTDGRVAYIIMVSILTQTFQIWVQGHYREDKTTQELYIYYNTEACSDLCIQGPSQMVIAFNSMWSHSLLLFTIVHIQDVISTICACHTLWKAIIIYMSRPARSNSISA